jgi:hypothetical protein
LDKIVFTDPEHRSVCNCCGANVIVVCRDVERGGGPYATYFAKFSDGPDHTGVAVIVGLGDWSQEPAVGRTAFSFRIWRESDNAVTGFVDGDSWDGVNFLGTRLSRQEALEHPLRPELFALSDFIVDNDPAISAFLSGKPKI